MLYPLTFKPILKPVIWGGEDICTFKNLPHREGIGESWELSAVEGHVSVVDKGAWRGRSLSELMATCGEELAGRPVVERFGRTFPLLIKFIDARQPLSVQVHPNDELAKRRHNGWGKTEMWYVVKASEDACVYSGFRERIDPETFAQSLQDDSLLSYLQKHAVRPGDVFFLPAGRVHAIGAGCLMAEIQQTSDVTYRIYDYHRKDADGRLRELHTELAKEAIDYRVYPQYRTDYPREGQRRQSLVRCEWFSVGLINGGRGESLRLDYPAESFVVYICLKGHVSVTDSRNCTENISRGETVLVPAANARWVQLEFACDSQLLETYIE
jgi:mannose-6-phosphate isomerase